MHRIRTVKQVQTGNTKNECLLSENGDLLARRQPSSENRGHVPCFSTRKQQDQIEAHRGNCGLSAIFKINLNYLFLKEIDAEEKQALTHGLASLQTPDRREDGSAHDQGACFFLGVIPEVLYKSNFNPKFFFKKNVFYNSILCPTFSSEQNWLSHNLLPRHIFSQDPSVQEMIKQEPL